MLKISKLFSGQDIVDAVRMHGSMEVLQNRKNGHTTGIALLLIGAAMTMPERKVYYRSYEESHSETLRDTVERTIRDLKLKHFKFSAQGLQYNIWY